MKKIFLFIKKILENTKYELLFLISFVLLHLPSLGHDNFNTDVWKWKARTYDFGSGVFGLDFIKTIQKYHPGVTLMWIGSFAVKIYNFFYETILGFPPPDNNVQTIFELDFLQKLGVVLVIGVAFAFTFYALKRLLGLKYAVIALTLVSLEPFYLGLTRVFHLEGLMTSFMIASFVWFYYFLTDQSNKKRLYVSAVFTGLAVLTKTSSLFMLPFLGLMAFAWERSIIKSLKIYWKWLLVVVITFFVGWPALWTHTAEVFRVLYRGIFDIGVEGGHEQFYFNKYTLDPGWTYYLVVLALRSSLYFVIGVLGYLFVFRELNGDRKKFSVYLMAFGISYLLFITIPSKKLDRYVVPSLVAFSMVGALFYERFLDWFKKYWAAALVILLIPAMVVIFRVHPDYFSYYSPIFGGLEKGIYVLEPKWLIGEREILELITALGDTAGYKRVRPRSPLEKAIATGEIEDALSVAFEEKYYTQIWPFVQEIGAFAMIDEISAQSRYAKYFVYPVWNDQSGQRDFDLNYIGNIKVRGVPVYNVYFNTGEKGSL